MLQRILVPLDGSPCAEHALSVAARIARATKATLMLLRVTNLRFQYGPYLAQVPYSEPVIEANLSEAERYLNSVARSCLLEGIETRVEVTTGLPTFCIDDYARSNAVDLIVICSHGYTGFKHWVLGSVAEKVARHGVAPVLLLRQCDATLETSTDTDHAVRALVALDGSPFSEAAISPALELVAAMSTPARGTLHLTQVVTAPTPEDEAEYEQRDIDLCSWAVDATEDSLRTLESELSSGEAAACGVNITHSVEVSNDVAPTLVREATRDGDSIIALATHGHGGLQRLMAGSVTERVMSSTMQPLLIVRPK